MLKKIVKETLSERISSSLIELIESGEWPAGKRIPKETDLAAMFSVSRSMTREALKVLTNAGILESKAGAGTFVAENALKNIHNMQFFERMRSNIDFAELYDARMIIEPSLAYYAALRRTPAELVEAERVLKQDVEAMKGPKYNPSDFPFHYWIAQASHNEFMCNMLQSILEKLGSTEYSFLFEHIDAELDRISQSDHVAMVKAIAASNAPLARELMTKHLKDRLEIINSPYVYYKEERPETAGRSMGEKGGKKKCGQ